MGQLLHSRHCRRGCTQSCPKNSFLIQVLMSQISFLIRITLNFCFRGNPQETTHSPNHPPQHLPELPYATNLVIDVITPFVDWETEAGQACRTQPIPKSQEGTEAGPSD